MFLPRVPGFRTRGVRNLTAVSTNCTLAISTENKPWLHFQLLDSFIVTSPAHCRYEKKEAETAAESHTLFQTRMAALQFRALSCYTPQVP
mmetsp:Transcript_19628/g.26614  ORF Transcript_19628/g.26614 Transcript_19628/m.26614 type:complete len:90 (+) Transcript_19628:395-664(+)